MKKKLIIIATLLACIFSSCTTYKAFMSEATKDPIAQKLPKMDFEWFTGGDVQGVQVDFVKNIVRNEIYSNISSSAGDKYGTIEVSSEKIHLKQNLGFPFLSGLTLFMGNLLGMPYTTAKIDMTLVFNIKDANGTILDTYRYTSKEKSALGFYYGRDASVCVVDATKAIMKQFRNDMNAKSGNLIAKLEKAKSSASGPVYITAAPQAPSADQLAEAIAKAMDKTKNDSSKENDDVKPNKENQRKTPQSDVDINIPVSKKSKSSEHTFVLIIANENYENVDNVNFAIHDGEVFKEYCAKTLCIPSKQIFYYSDATFGDLLAGVDKMKYALNNFEDSKAIVYYCGHGIPDEKPDGDAYILPIDGKGTNTATCYSLRQLYTTLAATKATSVTYFMDACFTGANKEGGMLVAARGVAREAKRTPLAGNTVAFSAASADETAMTYPEKGHGLFTYFLLKKLQETKGDVSYLELAQYIKDNVKKEAFLVNEKPQTPVVAISGDCKNTWKTMTLK